MLDKRLKLCVEMVSGKGTVCDVGTDHAYLAVELINSEKCEKVIASDIGKGPLEAAEKTVKKFGLEDKIALVLTDGLDNIPQDGISDIVIAGMGAETIISILDSAEWIRNNINLVLQPMTKSELLRDWLYANGFQITAERAVEDGRRIYTIICAEFCGKNIELCEFGSVTGHLDFSSNESDKYLNRLVRKYGVVAKAYQDSGKKNESLEKLSLYSMLKYLELQKTLNGQQIYDILNQLYPFSLQEKWDNSGFLVGDKTADVHKILLTLDITTDAVKEAFEKSCEMIISHHPVIFEPLKSIEESSPVYQLIKNSISAICMHTNLDIAENGTNGVILEELKKHFEIVGETEVLEVTDALGNGVGKICQLAEEVDSADFAAVLKTIFNCDVVRYSAKNKKIRRVAFCSGSGNSLFEEVVRKNCDAFITGDIKHDVWISSANCGVAIFDCGHFHTENLVLKNMRDVLKANLPFIDIVIADSSSDPVKYIK